MQRNVDNAPACNTGISFLNVAPVSTISSTIMMSRPSIVAKSHPVILTAIEKEDLGVEARQGTKYRNTNPFQYFPCPYNFAHGCNQL